MNFGEALHEINLGGRVRREGWNGKGMWLALHQPNEGGDLITVAFITLHTATGEDVPWCPSQTDILADDWENVDD